MRKDVQKRAVPRLQSKPEGLGNIRKNDELTISVALLQGILLVN